jgi:DNA-binding HxlR family transcriptional regulator
MASSVRRLGVNAELADDAVWSLRPGQPALSSRQRLEYATHDRTSSIRVVSLARDLCDRYRRDTIGSVAAGRGMDSRRIYRHFCMMARALEIVGERWSLLVVRDLLLGPQRFTDLARSLPDITPTRLTSRLRQLEAAGIVAREPLPIGREVWYRLTEAGLDLAPIVDALTSWGIDHALEAPRASEPVHPAPLMIGTKAFLGGHAGHLRPPVVWVWRFPAAGEYTIRYEEGAWTLARGNAEAPDLVVETTLEAWAQFLTARGARKLPRPDIRLVGRATAIKAFAKAFSVELRSN